MAVLQGGGWVLSCHQTAAVIIIFFFIMLPLNLIEAALMQLQFSSPKYNSSPFSSLRLTPLLLLLCMIQLPKNGEDFLTITAFLWDALAGPEPGAFPEPRQALGKNWRANSIFIKL